MSFLFDKTKIQVLGLFILTPASVALKNSEKQKGRSQFTGHKLLFLVFNLIPDVGQTLSQLLYKFTVVQASGTFINIENRVQHQKPKNERSMYR